MFSLLKRRSSAMSGSRRRSSFRLHVEDLEGRALLTTIPIGLGATIAWDNPTDITYGTALGTAQLNATASFKLGGSPVNVPGTFTYTPDAGTVLDVRNNQVLSVTFTPTDTTAYTTATTTATINVRQATATGSNVGVNLAFNSPYLPDAVWVDVHNLAFWWV